MKYHLVSGACGFVGRNLVKRILKSNNDRIIIVDNLSTGIHPDKWLSNPSASLQDLAVYENERVYSKGLKEEFNVWYHGSDLP